MTRCQPDAALASMIAKIYMTHEAHMKALDTVHALSQPAVVSAHEFTITSMLKLCTLLRTSTALEVGKSLFNKCDNRKREDAGVVSAMVQLYVKCGQAEEAIRLWEEWQQLGRNPNEILYICVISACASVGKDALSVGQRLYAKLAGGTHKMRTYNIQLLNAMLNMFLKCGDAEMMLKVLEEVGQDHTWDKFTYSIVSRACAELGPPALHHMANLYHNIQQENMVLDDTLQNSLISAFSKCGDPSTALKIGKEILQHNSHQTLSATTYTCILGAAAGVGNLDALNVGKEIFKKTVRLYPTDVKLATALINMFAKCGLPETSLDIWRNVSNRGMKGSPVMYVGVLTACRALGRSALSSVETLLSEYRLLKEKEGTVVHSLMRYFAGIGNLDMVNDLWKEFFGHSNSINVNSRLCLLNIYIELSQPMEAIATWKRWREAGVECNDRVTLICVLSACVGVGAPSLDVGKEVHALVENSTFTNDVVVVTALINMYCKCGEPLQMIPLWERLRSVSSYSAITCVCVLTACAALGTPAALSVGQQVHTLLSQQSDIVVDVVLMTALISMYAKCGDPQTALQVWRDLTSYGVPSNEHTYITLLSIFASTPTRTKESMDIAEYVTQWMKSGGVGAEHSVALETALLNMHTKSGEMEAAEFLFKDIKERRGGAHLQCWTIMIGAYGSMMQGNKAVQLFEQMIGSGVNPDSVTFVTLLAACVDSGLVDTANNFIKVMEQQYNIFPEKKKKKKIS